ncbi:MAG TPA: UbiA-like polyprenyltransferase [Candidatus Omnitrophota bacterium]|nr:UbiA-like polyprenyltransferase [Candidatus Omnitrophota bacterium]
MKKIRIFLEMIKFEHSIFALPFAYLGMVLAAGGWPGWVKFLLITLAMVSFRTMAMAANRLLDQSVDAINPRTSKRALPAGLLNPSFVWASAGVSWVVFSVSCWLLSPLCLALSFFPLVLAWVYPFLKRVSLLCHFVLGLVLGIAPYGAWIAAGGDFSWIPGFLMLGVLFWVAGFDIIYALLDFDFDREKGLHSVPARLGKEKARVLSRWLHFLTLVCWVLAGMAADLGWIYFGGLALAAGLLIREHILAKKDSDPLKLNEAFFNLNAWISMIIFVAAALDAAGGF